MFFGLCFVTEVWSTGTPGRRSDRFKERCQTAGPTRWKGFSEQFPILLRPPRGSVLILSDFTGASFNHEAVRIMNIGRLACRPPNFAVPESRRRFASKAEPGSPRHAKSLLWAFRRQYSWLHPARWWWLRFPSSHKVPGRRHRPCPS
jgi:hypothetical protein